MRVALCSKSAVSGAADSMMFSKFVVMTVSPSSENQALSTATSKIPSVHKQLVNNAILSNESNNNL
eukprot:6464095-Amphidinium_carterae.1